MSVISISVAVFIFAYTINLLYISVFYHRGLAHSAIILSSRLKRFIIATGPWVVGIDALAWSCMHRMHHKYADTKKDPHSPHIMGIMGVLFGQYVSYERILFSLIECKPAYINSVKDIDSQVHWITRNKLWWLPYIGHIVIAAIFAFSFNSILVGISYYLGIMSHPIQGWLVNSLGHAKGYRNFNTDDKSVNNLWLGYLVFGEGYQNNHHQNPLSAKFGVRWFEVDFGYWFCLLGHKLGLFKIAKK